MPTFRQSFFAVFFFLVCGFFVKSSQADVDLSVRDVLEAMFAARAQELVRYEAEFTYEGKYWGAEEKSLNKGLNLAEIFRSIVKYDGANEWFAGYREDGTMISSFTIDAGRGFTYGGTRFGSKLYAGMPADYEPSGYVRFIDPRGYGFVNYHYTRVGKDELRYVWHLDDEDGLDFDKVTKVVEDSTAYYVLVGGDENRIRTVRIDAENFRLISDRAELLKEKVVFEAVLTYSDKFRTQTLPSVVVSKEFLEGELLFEARREMTAFDPDPQFTENDFGMASLGMPAGTQYYDEASETIKIWNGQAGLSQALAGIQPIKEKLEEAIESERDTSWRPWLYGLAITGIACALLILYRYRYR